MSRFTTSDGLSLFYDDTGAGLPVLCLAGLTRNTRDFDFVAPHLPPCRLIRLDARGRGQSDAAPDWQTYTLPIEIRDVLELLDHLSLNQTAILGTSRGGLNAMGLSATHADRLLGVALNDVGPVLDPVGLEFIMTYLGRKPSAKTHEAVALISARKPNFANVPHARWLEEAERLFTETDDGLALTYDPALRNAIEAAGHQAMPDLWPFFDALPDRPLALIWGQNSELLSEDTVQEMQRRRPDMMLATVPDRGHIPFLDEPEALATLRAWIGAMQ